MPPAASPLAPGYKLDRYELLCPLAEGGMASVWVARQRGKHGFEKLVAIKTILPKYAADLRFQEMFLDEARIASRIEHLNVAQIFDLGEENEILYLVMEYVDGDALSKLNRVCQKKGVKIPIGIVLRILADTCAGLHEAHDLLDATGRPLDIVHRDVSPHNILVSTRGVAKLIDFGIAKARSRAGSDTNSGVLKGKIQYMAPEQAAANPVDRRADIWAVGAILYHLLAGKPPYEGDNQLATLHLLGSGRPPAPLPSSVPQPIAAIVRQALTHDPAKRFATAEDMHDAIERAMTHAQIWTTPGDVAQFWAQHMGERAERRRHAIEAAINTAADRRKVEQLLRQPSERPLGASPPSGTPPPVTTQPAGSPSGSYRAPPRSSTFPVGPTAPVPPTAPRAAARPPAIAPRAPAVPTAAPKAARSTAPPVPQPTPATADAAALLTARLSEPPPRPSMAAPAPAPVPVPIVAPVAQPMFGSPSLAAEPARAPEPTSQVSSYAMLGSASMDASGPARAARSGRRSAFPLVAGSVVAVVAAAVLAFVVLTPSNDTDSKSRAHAAAPQPAHAGPPAATETATTTAATTTAAPTATAMATASQAASTAASRDAGAPATTAVTAPAPPPPPSPVVRTYAPPPPVQRAAPAAPPPAAPRPKPAKPIDDGF